MATEVKVIKVRRGPYTDFDKTKMNAGEPAVTTSGDPNALDGKGVYMGVGPGQVKQVAMIEDIEDILNNALDGAVDEATQQAEAEADRAETAATQLASTVTQVTTNTSNIAQLNERMDAEEDNLNQLLRDSVNYNLDVLIECFKHVPWMDDKTSELLEQFRYVEDVPAVVNLDAYLSNLDDSVVVGGDVDSLRSYLTVTATYDNDTSAVITGYTLTGSLASGINTVNVSYGGVTVPVYLYLPVNNADGILYELPQNTKIYKEKGGLNTGIKLDSTDADYTVLAKITDTNVIAGDQLRFVDGGRTPASISLNKGVNLYANPSNGLKKYTAFSDAKTVVSGELSNADHDIIFVARRMFSGANATITVSLFVDGNKIGTTTAARNVAYNGATHDKPLGLGRISQSSGEITHSASMTVNFFRVYDRALTDTEINSILGVTI